MTAAALTLGSLTATGGYAWYLHSDLYRQRCCAALSAALSLPTDIGRAVPRSRIAREFDHVVVWMPERRGEALTCDRAIVVETPTAENTDAYEINLTSGQCEISARTWLREDFRGIIESGLRPGFSPDGPQRVNFSDMDLTLVRDRIRAELTDAAGHVAFENAQRATASVLCSSLNGYQSPDPVLLSACFSPHHHGIRVDKLELVVPEIPLHAINLQQIAGLNLQSGSFNGRWRYQENDEGSHSEVRGRCTDLSLEECTRGALRVPWRGYCPEIELQELRVVDHRPQRLRFRGVLRDVELADILATWGLPPIDTTITLDVGAASLSPAGIDSFVASGLARKIPLEDVTAALGYGTMTGLLDVTVADLTIEHNRIKSLDATFEVAEATDPPNWIEGRLLEELVKQTLRVQLPPLLPERIEYTRLGFRLQVRDEVLQVFGTHGLDEKIILTVRMGGHDIPLVPEPPTSFDLRPWLDDLRGRAREQIEQALPADIAP